MKPLFSVVFLLCILFTASVPARAELSVAVIDTRVILRESLAAKNVAQQLQTIRDGIVKNLSKQEEALISEEQALIAAKKTDPQEVFLEKARSFESKRIDLQKKSAFFKQKVNDAALKAEKDVLDYMTGVIEELSKEKGYTLIIGKQNVMVLDESMDITQDVLKRLDKKLPKLKVDYKE